MPVPESNQIKYRSNLALFQSHPSSSILAGFIIRLPDSLHQQLENDPLNVANISIQFSDNEQDNWLCQSLKETSTTATWKFSHRLETAKIDIFAQNDIHIPAAFRVGNIDGKLEIKEGLNSTIMKSIRRKTEIAEKERQSRRSIILDSVDSTPNKKYAKNSNKIGTPILKKGSKNNLLRKSKNVDYVLGKSSTLKPTSGSTRLTGDVRKQLIRYLAVRPCQKSTLSLNFDIQSRFILSILSNCTSYTEDGYFRLLSECYKELTHEDLLLFSAENLPIVLNNMNDAFSRLKLSKDSPAYSLLHPFLHLINASSRSFKSKRLPLSPAKMTTENPVTEVAKDAIPLKRPRRIMRTTGKVADMIEENDLRPGTSLDSPSPQSSIAEEYAYKKSQLLNLEKSILNNQTLVKKLLAATQRTPSSSIEEDQDALQKCHLAHQHLTSEYEQVLASISSLKETMNNGKNQEGRKHK